MRRKNEVCWDNIQICPFFEEYSRRNIWIDAYPSGDSLIVCLRLSMYEHISPFTFAINHTSNMGLITECLAHRGSPSLWVKRIANSPFYQQTTWSHFPLCLETIQWKGIMNSLQTTIGSADKVLQSFTSQCSRCSRCVDVWNIQWPWNVNTTKVPLQFASQTSKNKNKIMRSRVTFLSQMHNKIQTFSV